MLSYKLKVYFYIVKNAIKRDQYITVRVYHAVECRQVKNQLKFFPIHSRFIEEECKTLIKYPKYEFDDFSVKPVTN